MGSTSVVRAAKAWAWLSGRPFVTTSRYRIQLKPEPELEGATADRVLPGLLASAPVPR